MKKVPKELFDKGMIELGEAMINHKEHAYIGIYLFDMMKVAGYTPYEINEICIQVQLRAHYDEPED